MTPVNPAQWVPKGIAMDWSFLDGLDPGGRPKAPLPNTPPKVTVRVVAATIPGSEMIGAGGDVVTWRYEPARHYDFGIVDKKGRGIGMIVWSQVRTYKGLDHNVRIDHIREFTVSRNGEPTSHETSSVWSSREQAEADVERHIEASVKRFTKMHLKE